MRIFHKLDTICRVKRLLVMIAGCLCLVACNSKKYEVVERYEKEAPNFMAEGTHNEVHYVLLHQGHKIYAICDATTTDKLDPHSGCRFRPLHEYECEIGSDKIRTATTSPGSDLKCKDGDGYNVYLYVDKKE